MVFSLSFDLVSLVVNPCSPISQPPDSLPLPHLGKWRAGVVILERNTSDFLRPNLNLRGGVGE